MRALAGGLVDHLAHDDVEALRLRLQHGAGDLEDLLLEGDGRLQRRLAADAGAAAGPGAAAIGRRLGVAGDDLHLGDRHADAMGDDLREDGLRALALFGDA
jgi:hypothetical protein